MDVSGAAALQLRLEQQRQWQSGPAVRDGVQPRVDPDLDSLRELRGRERVYEAPFGCFVKRLVGGSWTFEARAQGSQQPAPAPGAAALGFRIEQQEQWRHAPAVRDGSQSPVDPDSHLLRELRYNERVYENGDGVFVKRLVGGAWDVEIA